MDSNIDEGSPAVLGAENDSCILRILLDHKAQTGY